MFIFYKVFLFAFSFVFQQKIVTKIMRLLTQEKILKIEIFVRVLLLVLVVL